MKKSVYWRLTTILALTALLLTLTDVWAARQAEVFKQLDLLVEVRHELVENYVEEPDQIKLIEAAVTGMVDSLQDPYTVFIPAEELKQFSDRLTGSFSGIGAEIEMLDGRPRIVTPLEDSPAWKAGIMAGDVILKVDGVSTQDLKQGEVIDRIKGEPGTKVTLTVRRETGEELDITITRAHINVQTVRGARRKADHSYDFMLDHQNRIGYVRISQFTEKTAEELRAALEQLKAEDVRGLILDVRFDPGGMLEAAVAVSDMFLTKGRRIVSTRGRKWPEQVYDSTEDTVLPDTPLVVLANEGSASASEVVTGALSDNGRALFVGTRTFGKGSVQQVHGLESGLGALKLTGAYYYLPSGRNIHRRPDADVWGVDPDDGAYVPMSFEDYEKMLRLRREADILRPDNGEGALPTVTPESIEQDRHDAQLAAALKALLGKLETGDWPTVGLSDAEALALERERDQLTRRRDLLLEELNKVEAELARFGKEEDSENGIESKEESLTEQAPEPSSQPVQSEAPPHPEASDKPAEKAEPGESAKPDGGEQSSDNTPQPEAGPTPEAPVEVAPASEAEPEPATQP